MRQLTQEHHIPLIVDDRLDVALAVEADGLETYEPPVLHQTGQRIRVECIISYHIL